MPWALAVALFLVAGHPQLEIFAIQGRGQVSPYVGRTVRTRGNVVTAVASNGFAVQTPPARSDGDPETSDAIFVFTRGRPGVSAGDVVDVTGRVLEFHDLTEIEATDLTIVGHDRPLPPPVDLDAGVPSPRRPQREAELERLESMHVRIETGIVCGPSRDAAGERFGEALVAPRARRAFREPGLGRPPELLKLDPDRLGLLNRPLAAGSSFQASGILGYEFGAFELWPSRLVTREARLPRPVRRRRPGELTVASLNLLRLYDDVDGPADDEVPSRAVYERRLGKLSRYVREVLRAPDVLAVQEAENVAVLQALARRLLRDDAALAYAAHLAEGNDRSGIDVGFLVRDTLRVRAVTPLLATERSSRGGALLHDRPPLLLSAEHGTAGSRFSFSVLNVHLRSLAGIDDPVEGPRVRRKRLAQAQSAARAVQALKRADPEVRLIVVGDFNGFEFTDGYVDVVGLIAGSDLAIRTLDLPADERYSFVHEGTAQALDHALTSSALAAFVRGLEYGRGNADAPAALAADPLTALRCSDHDGFALFLSTDAVDLGQRSRDARARERQERP